MHDVEVGWLTVAYFFNCLIKSWKKMQYNKFIDCKKKKKRQNTFFYFSGTI